MKVNKWITSFFKEYYKIYKSSIKSPSYPSLWVSSGLVITYYINPFLYKNKVLAATIDREKFNNAEKLSKRHNFIADVVEKAAHSLVYIEVIEKSPYHFNGLLVSNGSGFVVRPDGLVITNAHVVANKQFVKVKLYDGTEVRGFVKYVDPISDLAAVQLELNKDQILPVMSLGDSQDIRPGEWVVAMGSPLSLSNTITTGVISSTNRGSSELGLHHSHSSMQYIQTDASITYGNSGGPLVNLDGEAIGINTMKVTSGISFAIPINHAKQFLSKCELLEQTSTAKASKNKDWSSQHGPANATSPQGGTTTTVFGSKKRYLGITMLTLTPGIAQELVIRDGNFPRGLSRGVLVHKVFPGSPASRGGLHPGDVIIAIDGREISCTSDIYQALEYQSPTFAPKPDGSIGLSESDRVSITVMRKARKIEFYIALEN